jgi:beta-ureidopropionase / N-carbamoyl-L-amino-acid hydrolase
MSPSLGDAPTVDRDRLRRSFEDLSTFGATANGGLHRLALTDADRDVRRRVVELCDEAGFEVTVDRVGSIFATRRASKVDAPPLLIGSHLDSQPHGGRYDGPVGVVAAFEVMRRLDDLGIDTTCPVQLANWTNEEGARFRPPLVASGVFAGLYGLDFALSRADTAGLTIGAELQRIGFAGRVRPGWPLRGYIEIHIEQGTVLEKANTLIGVVTGIVGIRDLIIRVTGEDAHAGPLDMHLRRDALVGAARMIVEANAIGLGAAPDGRVTVGRISVPSDSHSVVPGFAEFVVDLRHPEAAGLDVLEERVRAAFSAIAHRSHLEVAFEPMWEYPPVEFDALIRAAIRDSAARLGLSTLVLPSRAGHDAWNIARVAPAGMIFIPCRDGVSHNEAEYADFEHIAASADVLLGAVIEIAGTA